MASGRGMDNIFVERSWGSLRYEGAAFSAPLRLGERSSTTAPATPRRFEVEDLSRQRIPLWLQEGEEETAMVLDLYSDWGKVQGDAFDILGRGGSIRVPTILRIMNKLRESDPAFRKLIEATEAILQYGSEVQDTLTDVQKAWPAARKEIIDDDYGLDPENPDDKKKIRQANAIFAKFFDSYSKSLGSQTLGSQKTTIFELQKHMTTLDRYILADTH
jgi:hypothetical protein